MDIPIGGGYTYDDDYDEYGSYIGGGHKVFTPTPMKNWWTNKSISRYRSSLGYCGSTLYDYSKMSYDGRWKRSFTDPGDRDQVEKLLLAAYKAVREVVVILDLPFEVKICFSVDTFCKKHSDNRRHLFLSTKCLDDKTSSDSDKIDVLCGVGVHESAHIKYSEVRVMESFKVSLSTKGDDEVKFKLLLFDILEDERVEDRLLKERPGYLTYITTKKTWEYEKSPIKSSSFSTKDGIVYKIIKFIRYRDKWDETIPSTLEEVFSEIRKLLEPLYNEPEVNTKRVCNIAVELYNLIEKAGLDGKVGEVTRKLSTIYPSILSGKDAEQTISDSVSYFIKDNFSTDLVSEDYLGLFERLSEGTILSPEKNHYLVKVDVNDSNLDRYRFRYLSIKEKISKYIPSIRKLLLAQSKNYDFVIRGCRYGLLDTTKLAEAYQGVPQVYQRLGTVSTSSLAICVLVDESGSMGGPKIGSAAAAAVLLNEAFSNVPGIELFIYGHTADVEPETHTHNRCTVVSIYKEPGNSKQIDYGLSDIQAKYENRDGYAILDVAKRVRKFTSEYCLMFIISDGEPSAVSYRGTEAVQHTKKCIIEVENKYNMDIVGICIDNVRAAKVIYGNKYLDLNYDLANFPKDLGKVIKDSVLKTRKTITS